MLKNVALALALLLLSVQIFGLRQVSLVPQAQARAGDAVMRQAFTLRVTGTKALFAQKCARCHGNDGTGETTIGRLVGAPDMTDAGWWQKRGNNRSLVESVTKGRGGMPAFGKRLTQREIAALVTYARGFKK